MFFWFVRNGLLILLRLFYRVNVSGTENIPSTGAFIICANHIHTLDPGMIAISVKRRIYFIAKRELWDNPFKRPFLEPLGVFSVKRGTADMQAYKRAIKVLSGGNGLLIFSQGHRMKELTEFKSGAALFALKTKTCIIPVGISGNYKLFSTIKVRFGKPISMEPYKDQKIKSNIVDELMDGVVEKVIGLTV